MNFKPLSKEALSTIYPRNGIELSEKDMALYSLYRKLLTEFIIKRIKLKEYDEKIGNSGLNFRINAEKDMDLYQYFSKDDLKYFYIRNNIYIERLEEKEKGFLLERIRNNNYDLDEDAERMVSNTYKKVIFEDVKRDGSNCITFYGPSSDSFSARNDSLVIGMRYDEFCTNGLDDNSWDKLHDKQLMYLYAIFEDIAKNAKGKLDTLVTVLKYNEFSIRTMSNSNKNIEGEER